MPPANMHKRIVTMLKFTINPHYIKLSDFLKRLPQTFEEQGEILYHRRNVIKRIKIQNYDINVKRYGIPSFLNRLIYTFFRTPKGKRAYQYPAILLSKGFETPEPIAYIEERKWGLLSHAYFVSKQCPYSRNFYEFGNTAPETCIDLIEAFARYTASLHKAGIYHLDYSPGNILFDKIDETYHFSLVDINRMSFGNVSIEKGCANFARLWGQKEFFIQLARYYASAREADESYCTERILYYRHKFWSRYQKRHELKFNLEL